jgi:hypothetical protein
MLQIYPVILSFVADVAELVPRIAHHDPDLARQLRRSSASVDVHRRTAPSPKHRRSGTTRAKRAREGGGGSSSPKAKLRGAKAPLGCLPPLRAELEGASQHILGTLYRLSFRGRLLARRSARRRENRFPAPRTSQKRDFVSRTSVPITRLKSAERAGSIGPHQPSACAVSQQASTSRADAAAVWNRAWRFLPRL